MTSVFIGGSRRLGRMNAELAHRLDNIIRKHLRVLIGDANGFDRAAQAYLAENGYESVVIYCTAGECRNNVGDWTKQSVEYQGHDRGREFYTAKDDAMLQDADYGLFAWDGKSKGTLRNIRKMAELGKPSAVYVSPIKKFVTVRNAQDASALSMDLEASVAISEDLFSDRWRATEMWGQKSGPANGAMNLETQGKLALIEAQVAQAKARPDTPENRESVESLVRMAHQLREELTRYQARQKRAS